MNISLLQCCTMLITLTILLGLSTLTTSEVKGNNAMKLCGQEFFVTYKLLCGGGMRGKRSILALPKRIKKDISKEKESLPVLKEKLAKQFLRRVRRSWRSIQDNANEECCVEACTYEEVKEYPCSPY